MTYRSPVTKRLVSDDELDVLPSMSGPLGRLVSNAQDGMQTDPGAGLQLVSSAGVPNIPPQTVMWLQLDGLVVQECLLACPEKRLSQRLLDRLVAPLVLWCPPGQAPCPAPSLVPLLLSKASSVVVEQPRPALSFPPWEHHGGPDEVGPNWHR